HYSPFDQTTALIPTQPIIFKMSTRGTVKKNIGKCMPIAPVPSRTLNIASSFRIPTLSLGGFPSATGISILNNINLYEDYLGIDSNDPTGFFNTCEMIQGQQ
ncbi:hypothetical protein KI387_033428, partial [Taxus chinensis]